MNKCIDCKKQKNCAERRGSHKYCFEPKKQTNYDRIKSMSVEEMAMFLMKVNNSYAVDCMYHESECKHPNVDNNCAICFREWLESDVEGGDGE